jgi:hypothetical protein
MNFSRQRVAERRCTGSAERCVYTNGPGNRRAAVFKKDYPIKCVEIEAFDEVLDLRLHLLIAHGLGRLVDVQCAPRGPW